MMNTNRTLKLTTLALCGVINILGGPLLCCCVFRFIWTPSEQFWQPLCSDLLQASFRD